MGHLEIKEIVVEIAQVRSDVGVLTPAARDVAFELVPRASGDALVSWKAFDGSQRRIAAPLPGGVRCADGGVTLWFEIGDDDHVRIAVGRD